MNKFILRELKKVSEVDVEFDENSTSIFIPQKRVIELKENHSYKIKLFDNALRPDSNSVIVTNWNGGSIPPNKYYKADISRIMNNMVKITGLAYDAQTGLDLNVMWSGWVIRTDMDVLEEI